MRFLLTSYLILLAGLLPVCAQNSVSGDIDDGSSNHQISIRVPKVSLVQVTDNVPVHLSFEAPIEAGRQLQLDTISGTWLNYSFIKSGNTIPLNHIYVRLGSGQIPPGVDLNVVALPYEGAGDGDHGKPAGEITIASFDQKLVEDIGSSYTGAGVGNGHLLKYSVEISNYSLIDYDQDATLQVVYTIAE